MDLSCRPNRLNERHATYLMPGQEMHDTPEGDLSEDHCRRLVRIMFLSPRRQQQLQILP